MPGFCILGKSPFQWAGMLAEGLVGGRKMVATWEKQRQMEVMNGNTVG